MQKIKSSQIIWNKLNGVICVYKPANTSCHQVRNTIIHAVCTGLNEKECRPPGEYVEIEEYNLDKFKVKIERNVADDVLVVGPRYQEQDLRLSWSNYLGKHTSGILLLGLRNGIKTVKYIRENRPTRCYRVTGCLGEATDNGFAGGQVVERSTWRHVKPIFMDKLLASMQASHQREMFKLCGVDPQSQAAYELAVQGPIRPANATNPIIYGIKCTHFNSPHFTIEIQCVNEYETYLKVLIHEIGTKLHSTAHCTSIQCIRHSHFNLDNALLRKHWTLQNIVLNMEECAKILEENETLLKQISAKLQ